MSKFVISTKKSLYKPIEIEVDGKDYIITKISPGMLEEVKKLEKLSLEGDVKALIEQLKILTGIDPAVAMKLDFRDISDLLDFIKDKIFTPEKIEEPEEKNGSKPVETK